MARPLTALRTTRLAPSPTGALHLGNARTFALTWLAARAQGAALRMRVEDLEGPRCKPEAVAWALQDLEWLGLHHDGPVILQSSRSDQHLAALQRLRQQDLLYPCTCSRRDVESVQRAPHAEEELHYPGTCRGRFAEPEEAFATTGRPVALRFRVPPGTMVVEDEFRGSEACDPARHGGDFVVARWDPEAGWAVSYQLAVVVDDAAMGVDWVIRGDDLLTSTPRQVLLQRALGLPTPGYAHLPLVVGPDGRRLAKRHGDTRLAAYRDAGVAPESLLAWVAENSGFSPALFRDPAASGFTWSQVPRHRVVVGPHPVTAGPTRSQRS